MATAVSPNDGLADGKSPFRSSNKTQIDISKSIVLISSTLLQMSEGTTLAPQSGQRHPPPDFPQEVITQLRGSAPVAVFRLALQ